MVGGIGDAAALLHVHSIASPSKEIGMQVGRFGQTAAATVWRIGSPAKKASNIGKAILEGRS